MLTSSTFSLLFAGTIVDCYLAKVTSTHTSPLSQTQLNGLMTLDIASFSTWFLYTLHWVRNLVKVVGLGSVYNHQPKDVFDVELLALRMLRPPTVEVR